MLTSSSVMNGLRVPWARYTLPFSLPLLSVEVIGSRPIASPTFFQLTMANHENSKLTSQKNHSLDFPGYDEGMPLILALKTSLTIHLSISSSCVPVPLTPTPIIITIITTLEPYIPPKSKTTLISPSSITHTVPSSSHPRLCPSITTNHLLLSSLFGPRRWNKYFHIPAHAPYSKNTFQFKKCIQ